MGAAGVGVGRDNYGDINTGLIIQQGTKPGASRTDLRRAYLARILTQANQLPLFAGDSANSQVRLSALYTALLTQRPKGEDAIGHAMPDIRSSPDRAARRLSALDVLNAERKLVQRLGQARRVTCAPYPLRPCASVSTPVLACRRCLRGMGKAPRRLSNPAPRPGTSQPVPTISGCNGLWNAIYCAWAEQWRVCATSRGEMGKATAYAVSGRALWARGGALPVDGGDRCADGRGGGRCR